MERGVDPGLRGHLAGKLGQPRADLLERERVVAEHVARVLEERDRGGDALAVVILRRRLADAGLPACRDLEPDDLDLDVRGA